MRNLCFILIVALIGGLLCGCNLLHEYEFEQPIEPSKASLYCAGRKWCGGSDRMSG